MTLPFIDGFDSIEECFREFEVEPKARNVEVLIAVYDCPQYEGSATVVFVKDGAAYVVDGAHCSCYGLEGQWKPERVESIEELRMRTRFSSNEALQVALDAFEENYGHLFVKH